MSIVKKTSIETTSGVFDTRSLGAEAQNVIVSLDSNDEIIEDITASGVVVSSTEGLSKYLKDNIGVPEGTAPIVHTSTTTKYGAATDTNYGHIKLGAGLETSSQSGATKVKTGTTANTAVSGNDSRLSNDRKSPEKVKFSDGASTPNYVEYDGSNEEIVSYSDLNAAPTAHASSNSTYGLASNAAYGHAKVINAVTTQSVDSAAAASAQSVYDGLAARGDTLQYDSSNSQLKLKAGNIVLDTETVEAGSTVDNSILTVTVDDDYLNGETMTCSNNDGVESVTAVISNSGVAVFSLKYRGTYTLTCEGFTDTVTISTIGSIVNKTFHIPKIVINVSTSTSGWQSGTVILSKNSTEIERKNLVSGEVSFKVYEAGTYELNLNTASDIITVSLEEEVSIALDSSASVLVPWSSGKDNQIKNMVNAYYNGTISLTDVKNVWAVGDERTITLKEIQARTILNTETENRNLLTTVNHREQDIKMVILDFEHDDLTTVIGSKTKALITVGQKDCLMDADCEAGTKYGSSNTENQKLNNSNTNLGGWKGCPSRTWCNEDYYNALPSTFNNLIKTVNKLSSEGNKGTTIITTQDKCWLLAEKEIFGIQTYSVDNEGTQYNYFTIATSNRYKLPKWSSSNVSSYWWGRSPDASAATYFCCVGSNGNANADSASGADGIAPSCCI